MTIDHSAHRTALEAAEQSNRELETGVQDRWYPDFHIAAKAGWINDPNGLVYYKGRYHAFFQHHPASTAWGPMHWGHVSSTDLVTWQREPIALAPSIEADSGGVYSGSCVVGDDGRLYAFYTGNKWLNPENRDEGNIQVQCLAISDDGVHFEKQGVVVEGQNLPNFRDPKVFRVAGTWYMVFGATSAENRGQVHMYTSADLLNWEFDRVLYEFPADDVFMLECPDLFPLGDRWVLAFCPERPTLTGYDHRNTHNAGYVVGNWSPGTDFEVLTGYEQVDKGHNFYAPQTFEAPDGRRLGLGWMGSFGIPVASSFEDGWAGQFTVPYELTLDENLRMLRRPVAGLEQLRGEALDLGAFTLGANEDRAIFEDADTYELEMTLNLAATAAERVGLQIDLGEDGTHTYVGFDDLAQTVFLDRRLTGNGDRGYRAVRVFGDELKFQVFVDRGSVEVFINGGEASLSSLVFAPGGRRSLVLSSESGEIAVKSLKAWKLKTIWR